MAASVPHIRIQYTDASTLLVFYANSFYSSLCQVHVGYPYLRLYPEAQKWRTAQPGGCTTYNRRSSLSQDISWRSLIVITNVKSATDEVPLDWKRRRANRSHGGYNLCFVWMNCLHWKQSTDTYNVENSQTSSPMQHICPRSQMPRSSSVRKRALTAIFWSWAASTSRFTFHAPLFSQEANLPDHCKYA